MNGPVKAYNFFSKAMMGMLYAMILTFALLLLYVCIDVCGVPVKEWHNGIVFRILMYILSCSVGLLFFFGAVSMVLGKHLGIDEEKEQRKAEIKEAMQEMEAEKKTRTKTVRETEIVECPLVDLNERQKQAVEDLLKRRIPKHAKDEGRFDRAVVYTYFSGLRALHVITPVKSSDDIDARRRWIEQITGLYEPQNEWAHFRGDYDEFKHNNKVKAAIKEIESEIEKFR